MSSDKLSTTSAEGATAPLPDPSAPASDYPFPHPFPNPLPYSDGTIVTVTALDASEVPTQPPARTPSTAANKIVLLAQVAIVASTPSGELFSRLLEPA